ncbi:hypothetical protein MYAM1_000192 [Malassezia yamatoensis]|uniref:Uncharacterized protein n=1 Tax=Malassezia yamatoensis TaxID=253288 RepID=A0AAJ5YQS8_9BASI|nr:hypothetical protein MYAM1_000192 [Malassezia yamatoensis]
MDESFPNPYDTPAPHTSHDTQPEESEEDELNRAIRESLSLEADAKERQRREEQEAVQAAIAASRDEERLRQEREQRSLLEERKILELSRQEARRREAELQRQALIEKEILEQSRRDHDASRQSRQSNIPSPYPSADFSDEESLLWLETRKSLSVSSHSSAQSSSQYPVASSSGQKLASARTSTISTGQQSRNQWQPIDKSPLHQQNPFEANSAATSFENPNEPFAQSQHERPSVGQSSVASLSDGREVFRAPDRQSSFPNPYETNEPRQTSPNQHGNSLQMTQSEQDTISSPSTVSASNSSFGSSPKPVIPSLSRYEAALNAAAQAEQDSESDDSWANDDYSDQQDLNVHRDFDRSNEGKVGSEQEHVTAEDEYLAGRRSDHESPFTATTQHTDFSEINPYRGQNTEPQHGETMQTTPVAQAAKPYQTRDQSRDSLAESAPRITAGSFFRTDGRLQAQNVSQPDSGWRAQAEQSLDSPVASERSSSRTSFERRASLFGEPYPPENINGQPALCGVQFGFAESPYSLELFALPTCSTPLFARPSLDMHPRLPESSNESAQPLQLFFPSRITFTMNPSRRWFVIRAYSWKLLLQTMAWYGHTALYAQDPNLRLRPELAFCMPRRPNSLQDGAPTFVSLAMAVDNLSTDFSKSTQGLETYAARLGATISTVSLAQHALALPMDFVTFAQTLFSAPRLSSAPALRDLKQIIAKHDEWLTTRCDDLAQRARSESDLDPNENLEWMWLHNELTVLQHPSAPPTDPAREFTPTSHREHLKQRVKKKLSRWSGVSATDKDLSCWITPYDLSQHTEVAPDISNDGGSTPIQRS